jgi:hypoxanthine phosphoribosyltransferase
MFAIQNFLQMSITIKDKKFVPFITAQQIENRITELAKRIDTDYAGKQVLCIGILNGSFIFAADLARALNLSIEFTFIKYTSYRKMISSGEVDKLIGLTSEVKNRHVLLIEDIIDTGLTMTEIINDMQQLQPASLEIVSLLLKPSALQEDLDIKYIGFEIENKFVVGYGLDYDGYGRNLKDIHIVAQ